MNLKRCLLVMATLLGLILVPLAIVLYLVAHTKGAAGLTWPAIDLSSLDPARWLAGQGLDPHALSVDRIFDQLASGPSAANATGNPGGVAGGTGVTGGVSGGAQPPDPVQRKIDEYIEGVKKYVKKEWEATKEALFGDTPPSGSQTGQGGRK
jgi:hypothetical protein